MNKNLLCSVAVITYNQEPFVKETLDSILSQVTTFEYEVVIGDDCSSDGTAEIIQSYVKDHPRGYRIRFFRQDLNIGMTNNFKFTVKNCKGKYIALLEGDDYWTDPYKLQKQVDYLERNEDCVSCHHWQEYAVKDKEGNYQVVPAPKVGQGYCEQEKTTLSDIFANKVRLKTRTHMFRNVIGEMPWWFTKIAYGDVALSMILGKYGKFGFIDEPMAVYRQTGSGVSNTGARSPLFTYNHFIKWVRLWEYGLRHYNFKFWEEGEKTIIEFYSVTFDKYGVNPRIYFRSLFYCLFKSVMPVKYRLRIFSKLITQAGRRILKRIFRK